MVVTVRHLENNIWNTFQCDDTVSSAPVVRLRDQGRCDSSILSGNSIESREVSHPSMNKTEIAPANWTNEADDKVKKDKKWSIGKLFRRKKKDVESESTSSEDSSQKSAKKKKASNKRRSSITKPVLNGNSNEQNQRSQSVTKFTKREYYDEGVLSDPSAGFIGYVGRGLPRSPFDRSHRTSKESLDRRGPESSCGSQDGSLRKGRKGRIKARVEAIRNLKNDSSSDEESQRSNSSSNLRFRSDDSLANHSKSDSIGKRTRSARTDRYIKRLSRDEEVHQDKETEILSRILSKADSESFSSRQRILSSPQVNGSSHNHDEPEYYEPQKPLSVRPNIPERSYSGTNITQHFKPNAVSYPNQVNFKPSTITGSNSSVYSYPVGVINFNARVNDENVTYSIPYNSVNKHHQVETNHKPTFRRSTSVENNNITNGQSNEVDNVMVVKFPLGNVHPIKKENPPMPPPRDLQRKIPTPLSYMYENTRPLSQNYDSKPKNIYARTGENRSNVTTPINYNQQSIYENTNNSTNGLTWMKRPISTSEDHIAIQQNFNNSIRTSYHNEQPKRPSSVTAEVIRPEIYNRYLTRPQINHENTRRNQDIQNQDYLYYADKTPRSRKPIHITPNSLNVEEKNANNSPNAPSVSNVQVRPRNASDFWRKMDTQETHRKRQFGHNRALSDQSVNGLFGNDQNYTRKNQTFAYSNNNPIQSQVFNGNVERTKDNDSKKVVSNVNRIEVDKSVRKSKIVDEPICYSHIDIIPMDDVRSKNQSGKSSDEDQSRTRRKSTNLEDALSELEAIYNSLGLGDEDLLERAEKRELMTPKITETFPYSNHSKENYFKYPSFPSDLPLLKQNQLNRRSSIPDKLHDDMAYRRMNPHERPKSKDVNNLVSQVSYMLASPVLAEPLCSFPTLKNGVESANSEPDVVYDDVVFRNIRQANNYLRIEDPQPPFGIPVGPITAAPHSDYLHANTEAKERSQRIAKDVPDIVTDDLAFRTLRKDRLSSTGNNDDEENIKNSIPSSTIFDNHVTKKKRAVRSLSANIFTLIQKEIDDALGMCNNNKTVEKAQSIPDLPEAVVEFGKSGKLPDNFVKGQTEQTHLEKKHRPTRITLNDNSLKESESSKKSNEKVLGRPPLAVTPERSPRGPTPVNKLSYSPKKDTDDYFNNVFFSKASEYSENPFRSEIHKSDDVFDKTHMKMSFENKYHSDIYLNNKNKVAVDSTVVVYSQTPKNIHIERRTNIDNETFVPKPTENIITKMEKEEANVVLESKGKSTEDSLLEISNQLKKVENKIKSNNELQDDFEEEGVKLKALAKKCDINLNETFKPHNHYTSIDSSYKYIPHEPTQSSSLENTNIKMPESLRGFQETGVLKPRTSKTEDLEKMPSFDDLRKGINELLDGISHVTDKFNLKRSMEPTDKYQRKDSPIVDDDTDKSKDNRGSPEYNSSEELAMIFNLGKDDLSKPILDDDIKDDAESHVELSSPKLVKSANQNYNRRSVEFDAAVPETSKSNPIAHPSVTHEAPWRKQRQHSSTDNGSKGTFDDLSPSKSNTWYQDTEFLMLACFYTLAYTQQLAGLDILTLLGLVLATMSIIAMLII